MASVFAIEPKTGEIKDHSPSTICQHLLILRLIGVMLNKKSAKNRKGQKLKTADTTLLISEIFFAFF